MKIAKQADEIQIHRHAWRCEGLKTALVPTMGNLHEGHLSLIRIAQQHAERVIVSVFVNPLQFGPNEDLASYPRTLEVDLEVLKHLKVDLVFTPNATEFTPSTDQCTRVSVPHLSNILCGASRPVFFDGIATIVTKLFNVTQPDLAVFGEKDFQQLTIIKQLVKDLSFQIQILSGPIIREPDGLAMSSRNQYLTAQERQLAPELCKTLYAACESIRQYFADRDTIIEEAIRTLSNKGFDVDYFSLRCQHDLSVPTQADQDTPLILLAAAYLGKTRLIDNMLL